MPCWNTQPQWKSKLNFDYERKKASQGAPFFMFGIRKAYGGKGRSRPGVLTIFVRWRVLQPQQGLRLLLSPI
jgi:hypothetical protein